MRAAVIHTDETGLQTVINVVMVDPNNIPAHLGQVVLTETARIGDTYADGQFTQEPDNA